MIRNEMSIPIGWNCSEDQMNFFISYCRWNLNRNVSNLKEMKVLPWAVAFTPWITIFTSEIKQVYTIVQSFSREQTGFSPGDGASGLGGFFENMDENDWRVVLSSEFLWSFHADLFTECLCLLPKMRLSLLNRCLGSPAGVVASSGCFMIFRTSSGLSSIISTVSYTYNRKLKTMVFLQFINIGYFFIKKEKRRVIFDTINVLCYTKWILLNESNV